MQIEKIKRHSKERIVLPLVFAFLLALIFIFGAGCSKSRELGAHGTALNAEPVNLEDPNLTLPTTDEATSSQSDLASVATSPNARPRSSGTAAAEPTKNPGQRAPASAKK